ncbi:CoB--CoM heterodisulfide reductase iron-sulfur subunit B family protein [bacterium]|nr:CoB--CoM heterodisulfide reductase iron-sulfur subunit B family protein [bacterium]
MKTKEYALYPGCTSHSTGLEYNLSMHAVFEKLGFEFKEIDDWNCCGGAAASALSNLLGLALPARNIKQTELQDKPLAIPCPGCFNAVMRAKYALENDPEMKKKIEEVVGFEYQGKIEVKSIHEVLFDNFTVDEIKEMVVKPLTGLKVVSYYGCALVRHPDIVKMGDHENPIFFDELVEALGAEPVDWSYKTDCCGADLGMTHKKISENIADKICGGAVETGADCILTACGLCQINLDIKQTGTNARKIPVVYFSELMGIAFDLPKRNKWWSKHIVDVKPLLKEKGLL